MENHIIACMCNKMLCTHIISLCSIRTMDKGHSVKQIISTYYIYMIRNSDLILLDNQTDTCMQILLSPKEENLRKENLK